MTIYKGIVKENIVVLPKQVHLPDGAEVEVHLIQRQSPRDKAFARVLSGRISRKVGMDEIIEADKAEREEHSDTWLKP